MRIDKGNPRHWYYLARSSANVVTSIPFRYARGHSRKRRVVFYDQMNGNIKAFIDYLQAEHKDEFELYFLSYPPLHKLYADINPEIPRLNMLSLKDMIKVARSDVIITAYLIEALYYYQLFTNIKFVDVWHGLPFRGYKLDIFHRFKGYSEAWTSSPALSNFYKNWGWAKKKIKITGYARVDDFVNNSCSAAELRRKYNIDAKFKKIILVAPTWEQKDGSHDSFLPGVTQDELFSALNEVAVKNKSLIILRFHAESKNKNLSGNFSNIRFMPSSDYPVAKDMLCMSDILISDWSSIVFDYLPLHRPTIFLNVQFPFTDGYTIASRYRFGEIVNNIDELVDAIGRYTTNPKHYMDKYSRRIKETENYVWGDTLDGKSAERYYHRLQVLTGSK